MERADEALYGAKHRGRNGYVFYAPNLEHKVGGVNEGQVNEVKEGQA